MTAVVMEAKTGKIIAATQRPTLHAENNPVWRNMLVQDAYEPGSVMKILSLAAAIDTGHFNPNATFNSGTWALIGQVLVGEQFPIKMLLICLVMLGLLM